MDYTTEITLKDSTLLLGAHFAYPGNTEKMTMGTIGRGAYAVQFFLGSNKSYTRSVIDKQTAENTAKLLTEYPMYFGTHAPYILNLCAYEKFGVEKGDTVLHALQSEIDSLSQIACNVKNESTFGVVVHIGSFKKRKEGMKAVIELVCKLRMTDPKVYLLLENSAGEGDKLGRDLEEISFLIKGIEKSRDDATVPVGVCWDTCHAFAAGVTKWESRDDTNLFFSEFDNIVGLKHLRLLHLNDSLVPFGKKSDRHAAIGTGLIWGEHVDGLKQLLDNASDRKIPLVLETDNNGDLEVTRELW